MRNLIEYPVTADEAISALQICLEQYTHTISQRGLGDIDGIAIVTVEKFIDQNKQRFDIFSKASMDVILQDTE